MGQKYTEISARHIQLIQRQKIYFVATAAQDGRVNLSPKGLDTLRVLGPNRVVWLNLTGSGNETAAHLLESDRMTLMFCAFEGDPVVLRLYGHARLFHARDAEWNELVQLFPSIPGSRQVVDMNVDLVQTSCGLGVPLFEYRGQRGQLEAWAEKKGKDGIEQYWRQKNQVSIDGKTTKILGPDSAAGTGDE